MDATASTLSPSMWYTSARKGVEIGVGLSFPQIEVARPQPRLSARRGSAYCSRASRQTCAAHDILAKCPGTQSKITLPLWQRSTKAMNLGRPIAAGSRSSLLPGTP